MTSKYIDPPNTEEIIESLKNLPTLGDVKKKVDEIFPKWIVTVLPGYSNDYSELTETWHSLCNEINTEPAQVLIVDEMCFDEDYKLIRTFAEIFTKSGFSVRRKREFIPCSVCGKALPASDIYEFMKNQNKIIPKTWKEKCSDC